MFERSRRVVLRMQMRGLRCTYNAGTIRDAIYSILTFVKSQSAGLAQWRHNNRRPLLEHMIINADRAARNKVAAVGDHF